MQNDLVKYSYNRDVIDLLALTSFTLAGIICSDRLSAKARSMTDNMTAVDGAMNDGMMANDTMMSNDTMMTNNMM